MTSSTKVHDAIVAADETFMTTFSRGDAAGMASLYTENGQLLPPNSDSVTGAQALQATFQALMDMGIKAMKTMLRMMNNATPRPTIERIPSSVPSLWGTSGTYQIQERVKPTLNCLLLGSKYPFKRTKRTLGSL